MKAYVVMNYPRGRGRIKFFIEDKQSYRTVSSNATGRVKPVMNTFKSLEQVIQDFQTDKRCEEVTYK